MVGLEEWIIYLTITYLIVIAFDWLMEQEIPFTKPTEEKSI